MNNIQAVKDEIERLFEKANNGDGSEYFNGAKHTLITLKEFINSLSEEPKFKIENKIKRNKDYLTYVVENISDGDYKLVAIGDDGSRGCTSFVSIKYQNEWYLIDDPASEDLEEASWNYSDRDGIGYGQRYAMQIDFKAGAEWRKQQMMKDAVECTVCNGIGDRYLKEVDKDSISAALAKFQFGDKVKVIVVKGED